VTFVLGYREWLGQGWSNESLLMHRRVRIRLKPADKITGSIPDWTMCDSRLPMDREGIAKIFIVNTLFLQ